VELRAAFRVQNSRLLGQFNDFRFELAEDLRVDGKGPAGPADPANPAGPADPANGGSEGGKVEDDAVEDAPSSGVNFVPVFHGARCAESLNSICHNGFDVIYSTKENSVNAYGHGIYFATAPGTSIGYSCPTPKEIVSSDGTLAGTKAMLLAMLQTGEVTSGQSRQLKPPLVPGSRCARRYDTFANPGRTILVATDNRQAYPMYITCYDVV
jgi:hypothetical protein